MIFFLSIEKNHLKRKNLLKEKTIFRRSSLNKKRYKRLYLDERKTGSAYNRFGFNGKEFDWEVKGWQNQYDYGFRIYDPRIGRFLSVDPLTSVYPYYTPYQFAGNMPIVAIDLDGLEFFIPIIGEVPPIANVALESNNVISRVAPLAEQLPAKNIAETSVETGLARPSPGSSWFKWLRFGRNVHKEQLEKWATEEGFDTEVPLGKGSRIDGLRIERIGQVTRGILRELKPNSEWGRKAGVEQLMRYLEAAKQKFPDVEEWSLELFKYSSITGVTYTIQSGDNLSDIAKRFGITVANLKLLNNIQDENKIKEGENILVGVEVKEDLSKPRELSKKERENLMNFIHDLENQKKKEKE